MTLGSLLNLGSPLHVTRTDSRELIGAPIHSFICSTRLLSAYCVAGPVLAPRDPVETKADSCPSLAQLTGREWGWGWKRIK